MDAATLPRLTRVEENILDQARRSGVAMRQSYRTAIPRLVDLGLLRLIERYDERTRRFYPVYVRTEG